MMGRKGPKRGLARGVRDRKPGGSSWLRILCSVCQWMPYSWHAWRLLISPVRTRRRISAHASMSVYTPASCRTASDHGRDRYRTAGTALERYTSGSADRTSASAALLDRRLHFGPVAMEKIVLSAKLCRREGVIYQTVRRPDSLRHVPGRPQFVCATGL